MTELAILIPTLGRADRLEPLVENIAETTPPIYRVLFVVDSDDEETFYALGGTAVPDRVFFVFGSGTYPEKINAAVRATDEPWLLLTADDVRFHPGWWEATEHYREESGEIRSQLGRPVEFGPGVIGTNDLHNPATAKGKYATQILIARWYIDRFGTVDEPGKAFHEGYHHEQIDRELCHTAQARGMYAHCADSVIEHLHHATGLRPKDATDEKGNLAARKADKALYEARRHLWEG